MTVMVRRGTGTLRLLRRGLLDSPGGLALRLPWPGHPLRVARGSMLSTPLLCSRTAQLLRLSLKVRKRPRLPGTAHRPEWGGQARSEEGFS